MRGDQPPAGARRKGANVDLKTAGLVRLVRHVASGWIDLRQIVAEGSGDECDGRTVAARRQQDVARVPLLLDRIYDLFAAPGPIPRGRDGGHPLLGSGTGIGRLNVQNAGAGGGKTGES